MKKVYNKIIRDDMKKMIEKDSKFCSFSYVEGEQKKIELKKKLQEEVLEFCESEDKSEIADILEVLDGIIYDFGFSMEDILKIKEEKRAKRGGFYDGLFLKEIEC